MLRWMALPRFLLLLLVALLVITVGCSGDDDPAGPAPEPEAPTDTTRPVVTGFQPWNDNEVVAVDAELLVGFSEPMDRASVEGALVLTSGEITSITWDVEDTAVLITHAEWAPGAAVTLTVGTGATDLAGNALVQAFSRSFYTTTDTPEVLAVDVAGDPGAAPINTSVVLQFSWPMDASSVNEAMTITESSGGKDVPGRVVGTYHEDRYRIWIGFQSDLTPLTTYTITIGTDAHSYGEPLTYVAAPIEVSFTTGEGADVTPPEIIACDPPVGSEAPADLDRVVVTFSEPLDLAQFTPSRVSAALGLHLSCAPVWNATADEVTLYLQRPLPPGLRIAAVWGSSGFIDQAGIHNGEPDSVWFTTPGEASLMPVEADRRQYYNGGDLRISYANLSGDSFERLMTGRTAGGYTDLQDRWFMHMNDMGVFLDGFENDGDVVDLAPEVSYLPLPVRNFWEGSVLAATGGQNVILDYEGQFIEYTNERVSVADKVIPTMYWVAEDCVHVSLSHTMTLEGETEPFETAVEDLWFAPGIGIVRWYSEGSGPDGSFEDSVWLEAVAWDDRWER